jgi:hypothetical protein
MIDLAVKALAVAAILLVGFYVVVPALIWLAATIGFGKEYE